VAVGYVRVLELRLQNGRYFHPRLGVSRRDARRAQAVVQPFVQRQSQRQRATAAAMFGDDDSDASDDSWRVDRRLAGATIVQLSSLGRRVEMLEGPPGVFDMLWSPVDGVGGPAVRPCTLTPSLFKATAMVSVPRDLMKMTVLQLKEELEARGASRSGALKSVLRGRLRAIIIAAHGKEVAGAGAGGSGARKRPREAGGEAEQDVE
jgi:hypothetical protein